MKRPKRNLAQVLMKKEYHKLILDLGPIPLKFVEQEVDKYLTSK